MNKPTTVIISEYIMVRIAYNCFSICMLNDAFSKINLANNLRRRLNIFFLESNRTQISIKYGPNTPGTPFAECRVPVAYTPAGCFYVFIRLYNGVYTKPHIDRYNIATTTEIPRAVAIVSVRGPCRFEFYRQFLADTTVIISR